MNSTADVIETSWRVASVALQICLLVFCQAVMGQTPPSRIAAHSLPTNYRFDRWYTVDGLPDNSIDDLFQTKDGYLWLGTRRGLARFDGVQFKTWNTTNTPSLRNNAIMSLVEDRTHRLWIGTAGGGVALLSQDSCIAITTAEGLPSNYVSSICLDSAGAIWIGTSGNGMMKFAGETRTSYTSKSGLSNDYIMCLYVDRHGTLWIGSNGAGVEKFGFGPGRRFTTREGLPSDDVKTLCEDQQGNLWIGTDKGLAQLKNGRVLDFSHRMPLPHQFVTSLAVDEDGILWVGTSGGGLCCWDGRRLQTFDDFDGLKIRFVSSLRHDREGNLWIGAERRGLIKLQKSRLKTLTMKEGLGTDYVRSVYEGRSGDVWIGTNGRGLNRLCNGKISTISLSNSLSNEFVRPLFENRDGTLWVGTWGGGIGLVRNGEVSRPPLLRDFPGRYIRSIVEDRDGNIWVGTNGQGAYRRAGNLWTVYDSRKGLSNNFVSCIVTDLSGTIWIGTSGGGLNRLKNDSITTFRRGSGLTNDFVTGLLVDSAQSLWISTIGGGLCRLHGNMFTSWTTASGLLDDIIFTVVDDLNGNLWLTGHRGISCVAKKELVDQAQGKIRQLNVMSFDEADGMRSSECSNGTQNIGCRTKDGKIWIPTADGLVIIDPRSLKKDSPWFPLYLERIIIDNESFPPTPPISVTSRSSSIRIEYTALSFRSAKKLQFRYWLEGFDKEWQGAGTRRVAFYTNVPPGDYTFSVEASAGAGQSWVSQSSIQLRILPPFWMAWWFRVIIGMSSIAAITLVVRFFSTRNLRRKLRAVEAQQALDRERMRISRDMHDDLGASLTEIALLGELAKRNSSRKQKVVSYLDRIVTTSRDVTTTMDEIVWAVNPQNDTVEKLFTYLCQHAKQYLSAIKIRCHAEIPEALPKSYVSAEVRHNVYLVVKEALANIARHSRATNAVLKLTYHNNTISISVEDNGKGIPDHHTDQFSNGLQNMRHRTEEIGGSFCVESGPNRGTRVQISISL